MKVLFRLCFSRMISKPIHCDFLKFLCCFFRKDVVFASRRTCVHRRSVDNIKINRKFILHVRTNAIRVASLRRQNTFFDPIGFGCGVSLVRRRVHNIIGTRWITIIIQIISRSNETVIIIRRLFK